MSTPSGALVEWTLGLQRSDLPSDIVEAAHLRLLDTIGIMLAATDTPIGRAARGGALAMGSGTSNRIVEFGDRSSAMLAALADGTLAHAMDFDDTHDPSLVHPSAAIVPTALAVGEMVGASGRAAGGAGRAPRPVCPLAGAPEGGLHFNRLTSDSARPGRSAVLR